MVKVRCLFCNGKGRVPIVFDGPMSYYNPHTGESFPHETCPACGGKRYQEK